MEHHYSYLYKPVNDLLIRIFGTPGETIREACHTLDFIVRHASAVTFLNLAIFNMPVGSPEAKQFQVQDFYEGDLSLYSDFIHPHGWGRRQVRQFLDREFRRHPAIAPILKRDPPIFTSNHAAFFTSGFAAWGKADVPV